MADGAGRGDQLNQNAAVARDLAKSAAYISTQVGVVRQAIYDEPVKQEYAQSIRVNRDYKGDAYPGGIPKLNVMLEGYSSPADVVGEAIKSLKTKYDIQDADLAK
jgi:hypothetical protein